MLISKVSKFRKKDFVGNFWKKEKFMEINAERHGDAETGRGVDPDKR